MEVYIVVGAVNGNGYGYIPHQPVVFKTLEGAKEYIFTLRGRQDEIDEIIEQVSDFEWYVSPYTGDFDVTHIFKVTIDAN